MSSKASPAAIISRLRLFSLIFPSLKSRAPQTKPVPAEGGSRFFAALRMTNKAPDEDAEGEEKGDEKIGPALHEKGLERGHYVLVVQGAGNPGED